LDIQIKTARDVDPELLADFYRNVYKSRKEILPQLYSWLYRLHDLNRNGPLILLDDNRIAGHLGLIPIEIEIEGERYNSNYITDLIVIPQFRKYGAGISLMEFLMKNADLCLGLRANEKARGVLKKMGYKQSDQSFLHIFFISPFNYPYFSEKLSRLQKNILNRISSPLLYINYKRFSSSFKESNFTIPDRDSVNRFVIALQKEQNVWNKSIISVVRNISYFTWRLLESPHKEKYRFLETDSFMAVIKLNRIYLDILCISGRSDFKAIGGLISGLATWGKKNGYSYIRFYTSDILLSQFLKKRLFSFVTNPIFLYYSKNPQLMAKIPHCNWNLELIDSDFEQFH
jgi:hypothetical protein